MGAVASPLSRREALLPVQNLTRWMMGRNALTMEQLARRAGVSAATVSRALSNSPLIAQKTRQRIQRLAEKSGYRVHRGASSLRTKMTHSVAVAIPLEHEPRQAVSDPFFLTLLGAIADALAERDRNLILSKLESGTTRWLDRALHSNQSDGLIVIGQSRHHSALNRAAGSGFPMVVWGARLADQRYVTVGSDNERGGFVATSHLIEQGCRHVAFLGNTRVPEVARRFEGYLRAIEAHGLSRDVQLNMPVHFDSDAAYYEVSTLLGAGLQIDGIVASSDVIAMSALRALGERGLRVPADVAVTGFDDVSLARHTSPPLTTVRQDIATAGRLLVEKLMDLIAGKPAQPTVLPTELIIRASSLRPLPRAVAAAVAEVDARAQRP
jgi:DNA-binding LacI/PurR family transcriptional regulator